jgi:photosystem II stability/assembly factor-like uncharacterized protein
MSPSLRLAGRLASCPALALTLVLLAAPAAFAQWSTQSPVPTHLDVRGIAAPTAQRVFIGTTDNPFDAGGALFESADGGTTWVQRDVPFSLGDPFNGLFFLDDQRGWAFGNANYRTTDGGTTWDELPFLGSTYGMTFFTPAFGLATGNFGRQISRDGGLSWEAAPDEMFDFDFVDTQTGLGVGASGVYRTTDGGGTFALVQGGEAADVAFLSASVAIAIVDDTFWRSVDGGQTWTAGAPALGRTRLVAVSDAVILAWGTGGFFPNDDGQVLRSEDGGQTWTDLGTIFAEGSGAFAVVDVQTVVALDSRGNVLRSADAGLTWTLTFDSPGPRPSAFSAIAPVFPDTQTGYLGYGSGYVLKTTDGGATWAQVSSGYGEALDDVGRLEDGTLLAVGERGTLLTSDGAGQWTLHEALTNVHLRAVDVVGPQSAVAVDEDGRVYRSADGGATWTAGAATPAGLTAYDIRFSTLLDGWMSGSGFSAGALFHTTDGGDSWTAVPDIGGSLIALDFEGASGWASYSGGTYYRSTDDGASWAEGELPGFPSAIRDMDFADASVGYAVGNFGYAVRSADGGETWEVLPTPNDEDDLTDLYLLGPNELWVSTGGGKAYYSATGGQNWAVMGSETDGFGSFAAVAATPEGDAWLVGGQGFIEHFAGPPPPPLNQPPNAEFTFVADGLTVAFTDASSDPDGTIVEWFWDFGDSTPDSTSTDPNPTHTFPGADTYHVRLTVTDDDGATNTYLQFVVAQPNPGGTFGDFTEVTPLDPLFVTPQDEDFWVATTAPADYDGDGDLDVAVLGFYVVYDESVDYRLVLLRNNGPGEGDRWGFEYVDVPIGGMTAGASDMAWGDLDSDGDQDLVVGTDGETVVYRNDDGALVLTDTVLPAYYENNLQADFDLRSISLADYDNDGDPDLLLPSTFDFDTGEHRTALLRNDGATETGGWAFTEVDAGFASTFHAQSEWADFDGDEDLDLLLTHVAPLTDEGFIRRYRNDGGGTFVGEDILGALTVEHGEVQWGDYDADGDLDVLVAGHIKEVDGSFDTALRIYRNDDETYTPFDVIESPAADGWFDLNAATWADYDTDGDVDILLAGTYNSGEQIEGRARVYDNAAGVFTDTGNDLPAPRAFGDRGGAFSWLDLDVDGDLDYFISGFYFVPGGNNLAEAQMHVYRNDAEGENAPPAPPTGLTATVETPLQPGGGTVTLSWEAASDDTTPAAALTYDLDLRRDGEPVATPRRLPEPGNVSAVTSWVLADLVDGTYTWTVRAVDSAYNGSEPAVGTFTVGASTATGGGSTRPTAYALEASYPNPFHAATTIRFALPERADVDLEVYDVLGRRVARLVGEAREAGLHEVRWDAAGFASGTYLVRLSTDAFTSTRRVLLVR